MRRFEVKYEVLFAHSSVVSKQARDSYEMRDLCLIETAHTARFDRRMVEHVLCPA